MPSLFNYHTIISMNITQILNNNLFRQKIKIKATFLVIHKLEKFQCLSCKLWFLQPKRNRLKSLAFGKVKFVLVKEFRGQKKLNFNQRFYSSFPAQLFF